MIRQSVRPPRSLLRVSLLSAALAGTAALEAQPAPAPAANDRATIVRVVDSLVADAASASRISSVSVAVVRGSDTLLMRAAGLAERETGRRADASTVYRLGSITKQFTASIVLQLVAEGKLALTDTVGRFFPWAPAAWRAIPISLLLNHTSGIPSYTNLGAVWRVRMAQDMVPDSLLALTVAQPLDFEPGTRWRYNNSGYVMLGSIIEQLEHKPYAEVVQQRIARPLGLTSLHYCPTDPDRAHDAFPYDNAAGRTFKPAARISLTQPHAAGALCSTARDLVKWNVALHGGKVVRPDLYARMTVPEGAGKSSNYAFGIGRDSAGGFVRLSHGGGINGFVTANSYVPSQGLSIVVLGNTATGEVDRLAEQIAHVVVGMPLVARAKPVTLTQSQLAVHDGKYELSLPGRTMPFTVRADQGVLLLAFGEGQPSRVIPIGLHRFMDESDENSVWEFTLEGERVTGVVLMQGQRVVGKRLPD